MWRDRLRSTPPLGPSKPERPTAFQDKVVEQFSYLRGQFLTAYAGAEAALVDFVMLAQQLNAYDHLRAGLPGTSSSRFARAKAIIRSEGPLAGMHDDLSLVIDELARYREQRDFLAHSITVLQSHQNEWHAIELRMWQQPRKTAEGVLPPPFELLWRTDLPALQALTQRALFVCNTLMAHIRRAYSEHQLETLRLPPTVISLL